MEYTTITFENAEDDDDDYGDYVDDNDDDEKNSRHASVLVLPQIPNIRLLL